MKQKILAGFLALAVLVALLLISGTLGLVDKDYMELGSTKEHLGY